MVNWKMRKRILYKIKCGFAFLTRVHIKISWCVDISGIPGFHVAANVLVVTAKNSQEDFQSFLYGNKIKCRTRSEKKASRFYQSKPVR